MSRPQLKRRRSSRGTGQCGAPGCPKDKAPGHFLCDEHLDPVIQVKDQIESEAKNYGPYRNRERGFRTATQRPTCCWFGCHEPRHSGNNYCEYHLEMEEDAG